ncbi:hypothetical protein SFR_1810 [Streptomyces sp. FR-008]|nr:hypothetical protein SFR_1810 [Streptomyces sp. FR-008]
MTWTPPLRGRGWGTGEGPDARRPGPRSDQAIGFGPLLKLVGPA